MTSQKSAKICEICGWDLLRTTAFAMILLVASARIGYTAETTVHGRITYEVQDGVYVNVGLDAGLEQGRTGSLHLDDGRTFDFEVLYAARQSALLRLAERPKTESLRERTVELTFEDRPASGGSAARDVGRQTSDETSRPTEERSPSDATSPDFVPLLAPNKNAPVVTIPRNVSHGRLRLRYSFQPNADLGYSSTRLDSSGTLDRIEGTPWSFSWSGALRYRDGEAYQNHPEYREVSPDFYRLMFQRPTADGGFLRLGRFVPVELPGIGYVDGVQGETRVGAGDRAPLRLGIITGLKPGRVDLDVSGDEPMVAGYATVEAGRRNESYYSGTVGLLNSYYQGEMDRLALLWDQRARVGSSLTLYSTAALDLDAGAAQTKDGARLTRLDVFAEYKLSRALGLRGGVDHWERPDNEAERDLLPFEDERFFDDGYWRYWAGSYQNLPWNLQLYEEVAMIDADNTEDNVRWQARLTRTGLFGMPSASASVTVYTLAGDNSDGYGLRASGYLPFAKGKLVVQPAAGFRTLQTDWQESETSLTYLSLYVDGRLSKTWTVSGGVNYTTGDGIDATLVELGLRYSW